MATHCRDVGLYPESLQWVLAADVVSGGPLNSASIKKSIKSLTPSVEPDVNIEDIEKVNLVLKDGVGFDPIKLTRLSWSRHRTHRLADF